MDFIGQIFLLFTFVATIYCVPDGSKPGASLPPASVFEMKPPKEFLDKPDDSKNLINPMKNPLIPEIGHDLPDLENILPDPKVFEMPPPKEFLELFRKDKESVNVEKDSKNLVSPNKESSDLEATSVLPETKSPVKNLDNVEDTKNVGKLMKKPLIDPNVFEMKPPKEFLDLFQFRGKENVALEKENIKSPIKDPSSDMVINLPKEKPLPDSSISLSDDRKASLKDKVEINNPVQWPSWSLEMNNFKDNMKFPDWFYMPAQENIKIEKHTELSDSQKPQDIHWNHQSFESHSYYDQSPLGDKEFKPFNMFSSNKGIPDMQNLFDEKENDIQVLIDSDKNLSGVSKDKTDDVKISKSSAEENVDELNKVSKSPLNKISHDEKDVKSNKYADAIIYPKEDVLVKEDAKEIKSVELPKLNDKGSFVGKLENKHLPELPSKISVLDSSLLVPVQIIPSPPSHYGFGNMVMMSTRYSPPSYGLPMLNLQMPSRAYGFVYTSQPTHQVYLGPHGSGMKRDAVAASGDLKQDLSSLSHAPESVSELPQTRSLTPDDLIISSIKHNSKDNDASSTDVAAMIVPSKSARNIISGNNMVINNGDKLESVDQNINGTPALAVFNLPYNGEYNKDVSSARPETNLNHGNIPNRPPVLSQRPVNYPGFGSNGNFPQYQRPENQGNFPVNAPNLGQPVNYPPYLSNGNIYTNSYPQNQQPLYMNTPYGSNGVPLTYGLTNGGLNGQNYQSYPGQGVLMSNPVVGEYNQNVYALLPIQNQPNAYLPNSNVYQVTGQVYNLVPAPNNVLLTTKDEVDDE